MASVVAESHAELTMQHTAMGQPAKKAKLFSFMDHPPQPTQISHDDIFKLHTELMDYCKLQPLDYDSNPLAWWKSQASDYKNLAWTTNIVLSIPASSAPVG